MLAATLSKRFYVRVTFADGNTIETWINAPNQQYVIDYYTKNEFQFGDTESCPRDNLQRGINVEFL